MQRLADVTGQRAPEMTDSCGKCSRGILIRPECKGTPYMLYEILVAQAAAKLLVFCDCEFGQRRREHLRSQYREMRAHPFYLRTMRSGLASVPNPIGEDARPITVLEHMILCVERASTQPPPMTWTPQTRPVRQVAPVPQPEPEGAYA